jgi:hypothetical protein
MRGAGPSATAHHGAKRAGQHAPPVITRTFRGHDRAWALDPAYDWIDTLADDFFLWAAEQLGGPDRGRGLRDHFRTGFGPG